MMDDKDVIDFAEHKEKRRRIRKFLITGGIVTAVLLAVGYWMLVQMLGYVAYRKLETLNSRAYQICQNAETWLEEGHTLTTHIAREGQPADPDSFAAYICCYGYSDDNWYGVVCDEQGELMYTLYSWKQIPEKYLEAPPEKEEMMKMLRDPFRTGYAVGTWIPEDNESACTDKID